MPHGRVLSSRSRHDWSSSAVHDVTSCAERPVFVYAWVRVVSFVFAKPHMHPLPPGQGRGQIGPNLRDVAWTLRPWSPQPFVGVDGQAPPVGVLRRPIAPSPASRNCCSSATCGVNYRHRLRSVSYRRYHHHRRCRSSLAPACGR